MVTANTLIVYLSVCCLTTLSDFTETCNGCLLLVGPRCTECRIFPLSLLVAMSLTQTDTSPTLCRSHLTIKAYQYVENLSGSFMHPIMMNIFAKKFSISNQNSRTRSVWYSVPSYQYMHSIRMLFYELLQKSPNGTIGYT